MIAGIEILHPGLYSSIQDAGRVGFRQYGVPVSGTLDPYSAGMANLLVGNSPGTAVLEITQLGPKLRFQKSALVAIVGALLSPRLNGNPAENNCPLFLKDGDLLEFGRREWGSRAYLAIAGGFQTEEVLGSRSWYKEITFFSRLEKGMCLPYPVYQGKGEAGYAVIRPEIHEGTGRVETFPGPEYERLPELAKQRLQETEFRIGQYNDRMGIQLEDRVENELEPLLTVPVLPGTVQLTPGGTLIVLMRDAQTTGGYPRVFQLSEKGMAVLAQKVRGEKIIFQMKGY